MDIDGIPLLVSIVFVGAWLFIFGLRLGYNVAKQDFRNGVCVVLQKDGKPEVWCK